MPQRPPIYTSRARSLRQADNGPERVLWHAIRNRNQGVKFRRQFPIPPYIADFACRELRLVVELDGGQHIDNPKDKVRNDAMNQLGWSVARFASSTRVEDILETMAAIREGGLSRKFDPASFSSIRRFPSPQPSPQGGEGEDSALTLSLPGRGQGEGSSETTKGRGRSSCENPPSFRASHPV